MAPQAPIVMRHLFERPDAVKPFVLLSAPFRTAGAGSHRFGDLLRRKASPRARILELRRDQHQAPLAVGTVLDPADNRKASPLRPGNKPFIYESSVSANDSPRGHLMFYGRRAYRRKFCPDGQVARSDARAEGRGNLKDASRFSLHESAHVI